MLRQSNQSLYEQNKAVLAAEKREREERHRFGELVEEMRRDIAGSAKSVEKAVKYSSRKLTGDTKNEIHETILNTMENCPEIFSSDFSLARLSEICGSRQEYVSQVINETFGCNFNELINKYRIREACRRIDDKLATYIYWTDSDIAYVYNLSTIGDAWVPAYVDGDTL